MTIQDTLHNVWSLGKTYTLERSSRPSQILTLSRLLYLLLNSCLLPPFVPVISQRLLHILYHFSNHIVYITWYPYVDFSQRSSDSVGGSPD